MVYANLMIHGQSNATKNGAGLEIMASCSKFINIKLRTSKDTKIVNRHMKKYILWDELQAVHRSAIVHTV